MKRHPQCLVLLVYGLLALNACAAPSAATPPPELPVGITWQWVGLTQAQPAGQPAASDAQNYLLLLNKDLTYAFKADCNTGLGQYTASDSSLSIQPAPITLTDCGPQSLYAQYMQLLGSVANYATEGDQLVLTLKNDGGRMTFARSTASLGAGGTQNIQIVGVPWQWVDMSGSHGGSPQLIPEPGKYTLILKQDGTYQAQADCNTSSGTYTIEGANLTLAPGPATLAACEPGSLSQVYLTLLSNVAGYTSSAGRLLLSLKADSNTMIFARM